MSTRTNAMLRLFGVQHHANKDVCWGYEDDCSLEPKSYSHPICSEDHQGWVKTKKEQIQTFYKQADFGFVKSVRNSLSLLCEPTYRVSWSALGLSLDIVSLWRGNCVMTFPMSFIGRLVLGMLRKHDFLSWA